MIKSSRYAKAQEYLEQICNADQRVKKLEMQKENLQMMAEDTANHLNRIAGKGTADPDRMAWIFAEIDEIERKILKAREEALAIRDEVKKTVNQISDPIWQKVILLYHLDNHTMLEIADIMRCSRMQVNRFRDAGYEELEKMLHQET